MYVKYLGYKARWEIDRDNRNVKVFVYKDWWLFAQYLTKWDYSLSEDERCTPNTIRRVIESSIEATIVVKNGLKKT